MSAPSLINCPACGVQVSNQAPSCPNCGQPISGHRPGTSAPPQWGPPPQSPSMRQPQSPSVGKVLLIVGCALLVALLGVFYALNRPAPAGWGEQNSRATPALSYPKERIRRGEQIFNRVAAKYGMVVEFGWQAQKISLPVPSADWEKLSKEDQVNVSLYAESLVPEVRASPKKYVDRWKERVETLELPYQEFIDSASRLCPDCWEVEVGKPVKDINGIWDVEGQAVVSGSTAAEFRRAAEASK